MGSMAAVFSVVGQPVTRAEGPDKVTGQSQYAADIARPGMLWGKVLRSPFPHARILKVDTSRASQLSGVHAVITGADTAERVRENSGAAGWTIDADAMARLEEVSTNSN